ncbi:MAG TPA: orotidine-5'-phosphate decarboxylase [Patescibacteria group bacterium]|nr:orotidine-5'-phosphate decarboxylase [Patescibacteria group bacterium]
MTFQKKLDDLVKKNNSLLCIGLDPVLEKLPKQFLQEKFSFFAFNKFIIDTTHNLVCCYKPNSAFYEALGEKGIGELKKTCDYLKKDYPEIPIILDAKRGDIGSTNEGYVQFIFDYLQVDAVTIHPYLGQEAIQPFLDRKEKGIIVLCKTSNPGAGEFQDLRIGKETIYRKVAKRVVRKWNKNKNCLMVVGATYPKEVKEIRKLAGDMTFLVPGIGAQGGDIKQTLQTGLNSQNAGLIMSSSRSIIFAKNPREEAEKTKNTINRYR